MYEEVTARVYPKVEPLAQALVKAATEQGATLGEFKMACSYVLGMCERRMSAFRLKETDEYLEARKKAWNEVQRREGFPPFEE